MGDGIFGGLFDLDRSGDLSAFESGLEMQFLHEVILADEDRETADGEDPFPR